MILNILIVLLSFSIFLPVMDISLLNIKNFYFIFIFLYIILHYLIYQKIISPDKEVYKDTIKVKKLIVAYFIDVVFLVVICVFIKALFDFFPVLKSINVVYVCLILLLQKQIFIPSLGFSLMKIRISNDTFKKKIKILIMNFLYLSPVYILFLNNKIHLRKEILDAIFLLLLLINLVNLFIRYFITKSNSLYEILLNIQINSKDEIENFEKNE